MRRCRASESSSLDHLVSKDLSLPPTYLQLLCLHRWEDLSMAVSKNMLPLNDPRLTRPVDNQGMFGQILSMTSFSNTVHPESITNPTIRGFLTAILELGAWFGVLANGIIADVFGRKKSTVGGVLIFLVGVIIQACAKNASYIMGGRFVTGIGVGILSMIVPLYNAELSPPELRGSLVSLQQLAICFGIMISYWIGKERFKRLENDLC